VKDVLAHLRVVENPLDAVSWTRLLCLLPGVGPRWANDLTVRARERGDPFALATLGVPRPAVKSVRALEALFAELRLHAEHGDGPAASVAAVVAYLEPSFSDRYDDFPRRMRDLEHFQVLAEGYTSLPSLLADVSLDPPDRAVDAGLGSPLDEGERLVLSTIHSAKGMEWRNVFLLGALDGYFPSLWSTRDPDALEEERRLMYVATTRAKDLLYVTYPVGVLHPSSGRVLSQPTRFLEDVPATAFERWAVRG
jgi:DNA helicase-2/ATP-dependent DNA helicase PcrA